MNPVDQSGQRTGLPHRSRLSVIVRGTPVTVAASSSDPGSDELVLLLHGLGCARASFDPVYTGHDTRRRWLAIDFPGHGDSPPAAADGDLLGLYADLVTQLVNQLAPRTVHLIGHSMGAAVALLAAPAIPLGAVVSIEGNLVGQDCGIVSRQIAAQPRAEFARDGFWRLRDRLLEATATDLRVWGSWFEQADPASVWEAAASLVVWCDSNGIASRWPRITHRTYLYGERTGYPKHLSALLDSSRTGMIAGAAHFPMVDNPLGLAEAVTAAINDCEAEAGTV